MESWVRASRFERRDWGGCDLLRTGAGGGAGIEAVEGARGPVAPCEGPRPTSMQRLRRRGRRDQRVRARPPAVTPTSSFRSRSRPGGWVGGTGDEGTALAAGRRRGRRPSLPLRTRPPATARETASTPSRLSRRFLSSCELGGRAPPGFKRCPGGWTTPTAPHLAAQPSPRPELCCRTRKWSACRGPGGGARTKKERGGARLGRAFAPLNTAANPALNPSLAHSLCQRRQQNVPGRVVRRRRQR